LAYIYEITNLINNKKYVGKTTKTIEERFSEHIRTSKRKDIMERPLYKAFQKYGIENFTITELEECSVDVVNEREKYWIEKLGTFHDGYNATKGGDGTIYKDYELIAKTYQQINNLTKTAEICDCDVETVHKALLEYNISAKTQQEVNKTLYGKKVAMFTLNDELVQSFLSLTDGARYCIEHKLTTGTQPKQVQTHIGDVANGKRRTAYGYKWKYI